MGADAVYDKHPQRKEDASPQLRNLKDILKTGKKSLKHRR